MLGMAIRRMCIVLRSSISTYILQSNDSNTIVRLAAMLITLFMLLDVLLGILYTVLHL